METIWITGGCGFIGSHLVRMLAKKYPRARIVVIDKLTYAGSLENIADVSGRRNFFFFKGDIADGRFIARIAKTHPPDYAVNCAAETHVDESIHGDAGVFMHANADGVRVLLDAMRNVLSLKKFVQVSTDEVYGDLPYGGRSRFSESSPLRPSSPYAASKAAGDLLAFAYVRTYALPVVVTRSGNNFGPRQYPEKMIPYFIFRALQDESLPLYGDGKNVRDWIFVRDHCSALAQCMLRGKPGEIYNIASGDEKENRVVAETILRALGKEPSHIQFVSDRPGHDRRYALDARKIRKELGWKPESPFEKALSETVEWYQNNESWIARAKKRKSSINPHIHFFQTPSSKFQVPFL